MKTENKIKREFSFDTSLDDFAVDPVQSYKDRLDVFKRGALLYIDTNFKDLPEAARQELILGIKAVHNSVLPNVGTTPGNIVKQTKQYKETLGLFIRKMAEIIATQTKQDSKKIAKNLITAEIYNSWQDGRESLKVTTQHGDLTVIRTSTPINKLTDNQKHELLKIHAKNPKEVPLWFTKLSAFEQQLLKNIIPEKFDGNWFNYEKSIPATLRKIPGLANFTKITTEIRDKDGKTLQMSNSYSYSAPSPISIKNAKERQRITKLNIAQFLDYVKDSKNKCEQHWGLTLEKRPVIFYSLVSPIKIGSLSVEKTPWVSKLFGANNNTNIREDKKKAIDDLREKYPTLDLQDPNDGTNKWGVLSRRDNISNLDPLIDTSLEFLKQLSEKEVKTPGGFDALKKKLRKDKLSPEKFSMQLTELMDELIKHFQSQNVDEPQKVNELKMLGQALININNIKYTYVSKITGGSAEIHKVTNANIIAGIIGIDIVFNCKSGKDRVGDVLDKTDARRIHFQQSGQLLTIRSAKDSVDKFVNAFVQLYQSGFQSLRAGDNNKGSNGIKDEGMLTENEKEKLGIELNRFAVTSQRRDRFPNSAKIVRFEPVFFS